VDLRSHAQRPAAHRAHKELVVGGKLTEQQFHDAILKLGPIPVEMIRASLIKQPLAPDFKTQWKFDGAKK
jgi:hypothetical protein